MIIESILNYEWLSARNITVAAIIILSFAAYLPLKRILKTATKNGAIPPAPATILQKALKISIAAFAGLLILAEFDLLQNVWTAVLGILGLVAVGFVAVWSIMSNLFCTLLILIAKPFKIGQVIEFPEDSLGGKVVDLNFLYTTVLREDGKITTIPNNFFFQKPLTKTPMEETISLYDQLQSEEPSEQAQQ